MTSIRSILPCAVAAFVFATAVGTATAQEEGGTRGAQMAAKMQARFAAADANHDGRLTREEAQSGMPFVYKHFDDIDKQKAGSITMADIAAYARDRRAARQPAR